MIRKALLGLSLTWAAAQAQTSALGTTTAAISGAGGSCTALSLTGAASGTLVSNFSPFTAFSANQCFTLAIQDGANHGSDTLTIGSVGPKTLMYWPIGAAAPVAVVAGQMKQKVGYIAVYSLGCDGSGGSSDCVIVSIPSALIPTAALNCAPNVQTGTSYSLQTSDNGCAVTMNNAGAITLTVPAGLPAGFTVLIIQLGAGQVTPTASGTTLVQRQNFTKTAGQYAMMTLLSYATNTFAMSGDMQ